MAIKVLDIVAVPELGLSLADLVLSIRGSFEIQRKNLNLDVPGETVYSVLTRVFWFASPAAQQALKVEMYSVEISASDVATVNV